MDKKYFISLTVTLLVVLALFGLGVEDKLKQLDLKIEEIELLQGPQGVQGVKGDQGDQGEQGVQGDRGRRGPRGPKGGRGKQGVQGPKGDKGVIDKSDVKAVVKDIVGDLNPFNKD